jgi:hypothetical protein
MADVDWSLPDAWGELGKDWWQENGRLAGCTDEQIRFSVLRHSGASAVTAAKDAGYAYSNRNALRQAAYRAARSTGVTNLLSLATAADGLGEGAITDAEVDSKIAKLVRSSDARVSIAAIEAREKLKARRTADGTETLPTPDEILLEILEVGGATVAAATLFQMGETPNLKAAPLLAPICKQECPGVWRRAVESSPGHEGWFEKLGNGPVLTQDELIAKLKQAISAGERRYGD